MIYRPFSKTGLVTLPKEARGYLGLGTGGGSILIDRIGRFQARIMNDSSKQNELLQKRRVTAKGQFTIPAYILRSWGVVDKGEVSFHIQEPYLIISLAGPMKPCELCKTSGHLHGHPCIVCSGTGKMRLNPMGVLGELSEITRHARKYGLTIHVLSLSNNENNPDIRVADCPNLPVSYTKLVESYIKNRLFESINIQEDS